MKTLNRKSSPKNLLLAALAVGVLSALVPTEAHAQIQLGNPTLTGNGCTGAHTASVSLAPDNSALSILFDGFTANAGGNSGVRMNRSSCIINIPVAVSSGVQVAITQVDFRGFNALPNRAYTQFTTQYSMNGQTMPTILRRDMGPVNGDFATVNRLRQQDIKWSACGRPATVSVNTSMVVQTNANNEQTMSSIDSADLRSGSDKALEFHILYRNCQ